MSQENVEPPTIAASAGPPCWAVASKRPLEKITGREMALLDAEGQPILRLRLADDGNGLHIHGVSDFVVGARHFSNRLSIEPQSSNSLFLRFCEFDG